MLRRLDRQGSVRKSVRHESTAQLELCGPDQMGAVLNRFNAWCWAGDVLGACHNTKKTEQEDAGQWVIWHTKQGVHDANLAALPWQLFVLHQGSVVRVLKLDTYRYVPIPPLRIRRIGMYFGMYFCTYWGHVLIHAWYVLIHTSLYWYVFCTYCLRIWYV